MAQARSVRAVNTYSTEQEDEVTKIFIMCDDFGDDFCSRGAAWNFWRISKAKRINLKSLLSDC